MSIATLKKKSYTLYGKSHSKDGQFSLNGVLRLPTQNLGRTVMRTPFRGPYPMGHGSGSTCRVGGWRSRICGHGYPVIISNSGSCITPQTEIKRTTMTVLGLYQKKSMGILHGTYPNTAVHKIDKDEGTYIRKIASETIFSIKKDEGYINSLKKCTPYTKDEHILTSGQYLQASTCLSAISLPYKGINSCAS